MEHPESLTAALTANEPPDGTTIEQLIGDLRSIVGADDRIVVQVGDIEYEITGIFRRPADAYVIETGAVYALGEKLADF
jgi:hypothetical protein